MITIYHKSKFYGISYPIFCLHKHPEDIKVINNKINIKKTESHNWGVLDEYSPNTPFLSRYLFQDTGRFTFDYTCRNITQLISKPVKWGIDSKAKIFDLSKKQKFKARNVKIKRVVKNIIWLDTISYPFEIPKNVSVPRDLLNQWVTIVLIDGVWEIYKFYSFSKPTESILL